MNTESASCLVFCWISKKISYHHEKNSLYGIYSVINITANENLVRLVSVLASREGGENHSWLNIP